MIYNCQNLINDRLNLIEWKKSAELLQFIQINMFFDKLC